MSGGGAGETKHVYFLDPPTGDGEVACVYRATIDWLGNLCVWYLTEGGDEGLKTSPEFRQKINGEITSSHRWQCKGSAVNFHKGVINASMNRAVLFIPVQDAEYDNTIVVVNVSDVFMFQKQDDIQNTSYLTHVPLVKLYNSHLLKYRAKPKPANLRGAHSHHEHEPHHIFSFFGWGQDIMTLS